MLSLPPLSQEMLEVRLEKKLDFILSRLRLAALWLKEKHIDYWQNWLDPEELYIKWIEEGIEEGQFFRVDYDGTWIGIFRLQWEDELFWGKQTVPSAYIHSFTTNRDLNGQGLGRVILEWISDYARQSGKIFLRLDCQTHIRDLCRYYEDLGFSPKGEVTLYDHILTLYQKTI